jgi:hypothetical protein
MATPPESERETLVAPVENVERMTLDESVTPDTTNPLLPDLKYSMARSVDLSRATPLNGDELLGLLYIRINELVNELEKAIAGSNGCYNNGANEAHTCLEKLMKKIETLDKI